MLIIKFGGSIITEKEKVIKIIEDELKVHQRLIIVTSAMGRYPDPYATDTLRQMATDVDEDNYNEIVSCGEVISGINLANELCKKQIDTKFLSVYDFDLKIDDNLEISERVKNYLLKYRVIIIPGFMALKKQKITLLPRGGSNLTAVFLADYFRSPLMIVTDVDGIYQHHPKNFLAKKLSFVSTFELALLITEHPRLFPIEVIKYLKRNHFMILFCNLDSKNGSLIANF